MINFIQLPSRGKLRYLWTIGHYAEIAKLYEANTIFREIFIKNFRKLELNSIYFTSLLHLDRYEDIEKAKHKIQELKESNVLPLYLELNKFAIEELNMVPNSAMSKSYDAIQILPSFKPINHFWEKFCKNKNLAIVGNAPVKTKNSSDIDCCDIVPRFNKFRISGYEDYIGRRTDVWCHICDVQPDIETIYNTININILTDNPLNTPVGNYFLDNIFNSKKEFFYIPQSNVVELANTLQAIPSSGARVLVSLSQNRYQLNIDCSIFGFSFLDSNYNKNLFEHYFESKTQKKERTHSITNEVSLLRNLFL